MKRLVFCLLIVLIATLTACSKGSSERLYTREGEQKVAGATSQQETFTLNVALLIYNPVNPQDPDETLYAKWDYHNPDLLAAEAKALLESASKGYLKVNIAGRIEVPDFPEHEDGFKYKWSDWTDNDGNGKIDNPTATSKVSYVKILSNNGLPAQIDAKVIDEVWYFAPSGVGLYESAMGGKGGFWINGGMSGGSTITKRRFVVMWFNVGHGRGFPEKDMVSLHAFGHRAENTMERVYDSRGNYRETPWGQITKMDKDFPGQAGIGVIHGPPNGTNSGYDYNNDWYVPSTAEDFKNNYPNLTGQTTLVNNLTWGGNDKGFSFWWFDHLPSASGTRDDIRGKNGKLYPFRPVNNWWKYIFNLNSIPLWAEIDGYNSGGSYYDDATDTYWTTASSPPVFEPFGDQTVKETNAKTMEIKVWDLKGEVVTLQMENLDNLSGVNWQADSWKNPYSGQFHGARGMFTVTAPIGSVGTYRFRFTASDGNEVTVKEISILVEPAFPDLTLVLYGDTNGWYGETRNQTALVVNQGDLNIQQTVLNVYLSYDAILDGSDTLVGTHTVPSLAPAASARVDYSVTIPSNWANRMVYVLAVVDPDNTVAEIDDTNNTMSRTIGMTKLPFDVNGDGSVTISDIFSVAGTFGAVPGDLKWNSSADVDGDRATTITDIFAVSGHFGDVDSHVELHSSAGPTSGTVPLQVTFNYNAHYFEGSVTKVEIDFGDGAGWQTVATGSSAELNGSYNHWYMAVGSYATKIRATDSNGFVDSAGGPTIMIN